LFERWFAIVEHVLRRRAQLAIFSTTSEVRASTADVRAPDCAVSRSGLQCAHSGPERNSHMATDTKAAPLVEGEIIAGKYRVGRVLGQGGMGVVVAATHLQLDQEVALKFLLPEALKQPEVVARFTREARAAAKIQSEHVARVLDVGELASGEPYMVMEYLDGEDLDQALRRRGSLPVAEAVGYLLEGCEAVAEAHALGIIHRDLKPANLYLARRPGGTPTVKVLDFGISKSPAGAGDPGLTQTSAMFGSPPYMSPEQVRSTRSADARSDIWSLGAVLYELLTGQRPFEGESAPVVFVAILHKDPVPPSELRPDLPRLLDMAVMRCLQKDPALRFPDVAAFAAAVGPFGPPSSADSVVRISHVLGIGQRAATLGERVAPTVAAGFAMDATVGSPVTAPAPPAEKSVTAGPVAAAAAPPALSRPLPLEANVPLPAAPVARTETVAGRASARSGATRTTVTVVALVVLSGAGGAYWFGARRGDSPAPAHNNASVEAPAVVTAPPSAIPTPAPRAELEPSTPVPRPAARPEERRAATSHRAIVTAPPAPTAGVSTAVCAELLERESLGETLTPREKAIYARQCSHK
jgi:eukaryotic-like serine/threonine-protein kinase